MSSRLSGFLSSANTVYDAITLWKKDVIRDLAVDIRRREVLARRYDSIDDALFADAFADAAPDPNQAGVDEVPIRKRKVDALVALPRTSKRSKIPALSSIDRVAEALAGVSTKRALVTREKLRAGLHDQKGLLSLVETSTDALEKTKRLELLKTAGIHSPDKNS